MDLKTLSAQQGPQADHRRCLQPRRYSVRVFAHYDLDSGTTFYAVGMPTWLEGMLGRAADEIPRHWVAVTTADDLHYAPQRDGAL